MLCWAIFGFPWFLVVKQIQLHFIFLWWFWFTLVGNQPFFFQGTYYLPTANQNMRQPRMQGMNNGQVPGSNLTFMTSMPGNLPFMTSGMTPTYNGNQGLQFVQNPSGQFMVSALLSSLGVCCTYCFTDIIWNRRRSRVPVQNQIRGLIITLIWHSSKNKVHKLPWHNQETRDLIMVTTTQHASKYKVHKFH